MTQESLVNAVAVGSGKVPALLASSLADMRKYAKNLFHAFVNHETLFIFRQ